MNTEISLYPLWLRVWHWINALLFLLLTVTGISLHFAAPGMPLIPFSTAQWLHNVGGILLTLGYLFFVVSNLLSGNVRHYRLRLRGLYGRMRRQAHFYAVGIFRGDPHPFPASFSCKFNPLQQITYLFVIYVGLPVLIVTGILFLFPEYAPNRVLGMGGIWPVAVAHYIVGFLLFLFMLGHIYLATAGETVTGEFKKMILGDHHDDL